MRSSEILKYEGKNVFLKLKNGYHYTATIVKINDDSIEIIDKYHIEKIIDIGHIAEIEELRGVSE